MATHFRIKVEPPNKGRIAVRRAGPSLDDLRQQADEALRAEEGQDFGPLTHAERNKILFGIK